MAASEIAAKAAEVERRHVRIAAFETIGCALASLRRLDHVWFDDDIRNTITQVREALSVAQSKIKERIAQ